MLVLWVGELVIEVGFFFGVVNILFGYGLIVGVVIFYYKDIDKVVFIGLIEVGCLIMEVVVKSNLKWVILELGGKSLNIVFVDVDMDVVIEGFYFVLFFN